MTGTNQNTPLAYNHMSVDCVVFGFDGEKMCVLLIKRSGEENGEFFSDMKLPGSLIYMDENLDEAAKRVLGELTGLKNVNLFQFKAFSSKDRTSDPKDIHWLERAQNQKVERIVTVAYISLVKISRAFAKDIEAYKACWVPINEVPRLAFDHNLIIKEAVNYLSLYYDSNPQIMFNLLPQKFTASQFRKLYGIVTGKSIDARNFYKKLAIMPYVVPLEEKEQGVSHRAARYFRFDKKIYNKTRI